jgi:hypothetical protein
VLGVALFVGLLVACPVAFGATPQPFWTSCATNTVEDVQCSLPRGVVSAPVTAGIGVAGDVYVSDQVHRRVVEFTSFGIFVRTFGWKVNKTKVEAAAPEPEQNVCPVDQDDICQAASSGTGAAAFELSPQGVAIDSAGNVYVVDSGNQRVQKFDAEGHFMLMWGKGVNGGTAVNKEICTNIGPPAEVCNAGEEGTGPGQFGAWALPGSYIAVDTRNTATTADDWVYVGDAGRIQRFNVEGEYQADVPDPTGVLTGKRVSSLAVVPAGNLFVGLESTKDIFELDASSGAKLGTCATATTPQAVAADAAGSAYVIGASFEGSVRKFDSVCKEVVEEQTVFPFFPTYPFSPGFSEGATGIAIASACLTAPAYNLIVSGSALSPNGFVRDYGPPPDPAHIALCPPPLHSPEIEFQGAVSVETDQADVRAKINPKFWKDTSSFVQYGTASCIEGEGWAGACVKQSPLQPVQLEAGPINVGAMTRKVVLAGLVPQTEYRYRFVAQSRFDRNGVEVNEKGGPVFGVGGTEALDGEVASFTTEPIPAMEPDTCANKAFRTGPGALLPDCRAYEMVSPVDKNGGNIRPSKEDAYIQVASDGNRIAYTAIVSFGDEPSSKIDNEYLATRSEAEKGKGAWLTHGINAPLGRLLGSETEKPEYLFREVSAFSPDLCSEWLVDYNVIPLTLDAPQGYVNLYRQDLCGESGFEAVTKAPPPPDAEALFYLNKDTVQGFSDDLSQVFFIAEAGLTPDAVAGKTESQIYDYSGGELHLVSVLPGGIPDPGAGTGAEVGNGVKEASGGMLEHAVSSDGSRAFWTSAANLGVGKLYLREHPEQGIVAEECNEAAKACTIPVSSSNQATFWAATPDGSAALYSEGSLGDAGNATLYRFDVDTEERTVQATHVVGLLGASDNLSRVYLVSTSVLTPGEENSEGDEAVASKPNLYLDEEGDFTFIGTLLGGKDGDVANDERGSGQVYQVASKALRYRPARVTPDGSRIAFQSRAKPTHFDNTDVNNGKADVEVFTYEAGGTLHCVSCRQSGVSPSGQELPPPNKYPQLLGAEPTGVWGAAWIPGWKHQLHATSPLSDDGKRLFFNSFEALVPRDTNGAQDVYEWEAPGAGGCSKGVSAYHELNGGCIYLISSGESPFESEFWDATADGHDVFFTTEAGLLPQDPGLIDLYDARVGGGFAQPSAAEICEGETCQISPAPPRGPTPGSSTYTGDHNESPPPGCRKGKIRRKGRCVAKKPHKRRHHRAAKTNRRAAR